MIGSSVMHQWPRGLTPPGRCVNIGVNGLTALELGRAAVGRCLTPLDTVVFYCGSNDLFWGYPSSVIHKRICSLLDTYPCPIRFVAIMYSPYMSNFVDRRALDALNVELESYLGARRDGSTMVRFSPRRYKRDGLHLPREEYRALADLVFG